MGEGELGTARNAGGAGSESAGWVSRLVARFVSPSPVDAASLAVYRILFGVLLFGGIVRFASKGLVGAHYVEPRLFLPYFGFTWLPAPGPWAYAIFAALGVLALAICFGCFTRLACALFCALFSYVHLLDATYYLNHYYLVSLLTLLLAFAPAANALSIDAWRKPRPACIPAWWLHLLRFQVGLVYFFAGVAKLQSDWLVLGQPLRTWLAANADLPLLGALFVQPWFAVLMSWLGALFDLSIPFWLSWRRARVPAFLVLTFFHGLTARLFEIGIFPYLMVVNALLFFPPDWPRRFLPARWFGALEVRSSGRSLSAIERLVMGCYMALQLVLPLRHFAYSGNLLWTEQGYRFAWHVMVIEKTGSTEFVLVDRDTGKRRVVFPRRYLSQSQTKAMATQPDLILAFAHYLAARERAEGHDVAVFADALAVLNGRAPARLIDPAFDLTQAEDGFADKPWITRGPGP
ncbi:MAG: HTTM domain-containing protein [Myxococcales bacterium]